MGENAYWISKRERVEVVKIEMKKARYSSPGYHCRRSDGSMTKIVRSDILLDDEARLIDELDEIIKRNKNPYRSERYSLLMKFLLVSEVPFHSRLKELKQSRESSKSEQLLFELPI